MKNSDVFELEVIRRALSSIAEEMSLVVVRSARSPLLREAGDVSSALTDGDGELIAQGHDVPVHLGVMSFVVKEFLKVVPREKLKPGDVWFTNLPEVGGNHLPDVKAIRPIFSEGNIVAFAAVLAHWADIGGAAPGSYYAAARDIWQEGLRISPLRLVSADGWDSEKLSIILANVRGKQERQGDLLAQAAATHVAERRLIELLKKYGNGNFTAAVARFHDVSEQQMRDAILSLPDGVYEGIDHMDDGGPNNAPVAVRVRIEINRDEAHFDFSKTDDAIEGPLNTTKFVAAAAVFYAIRAVAGPEIQPNAGCYRPIKITTRPGSLLQAPEDMPVVGGNHESSQRAVDAIFKAFEAAVPEKLSAGSTTTAGLLIFGGKRDDGVWTTFYEPHGGGEGARINRDGYSVTRAHLVNVMNTPIEVIEAEYPLRVTRQAVRYGSGGAGRHRGGDGQIREYEVLSDSLSLTTMFERRIVAPYGLQGGEDGLPFKVMLIGVDGQEQELPGKLNLKLSKGQRVRIETPGGGGFGRSA